MRTLRNIGIVCLLAILIVSCDKMGAITYKVRNDAASQVQIVALLPNMETGVYEPDTFLVKKGGEVTLTTQRGMVNQPVNDFRETEDTIRYIHMLRATRDGAETKTSLLVTDRWNYSRRSDWIASYTLSITEQDF